MIDEVRVLESTISDRGMFSDRRLFTYLPRGGPSSAGGLRGRSWRLFDTACSLNEPDLPLVERLLLVKLSVCDLLTFRPNILGRSGDEGRRAGWRQSRIYIRKRRGMRFSLNDTGEENDDAMKQEKGEKEKGEKGREKQERKERERTRRTGWYLYAH